METVVDLRALPLSHKPGFSKKALSNALKLGGLAYIHIPDPGCPKPMRNDYRKGGDWKRFAAPFLEHLKAQGDSSTQCGAPSAPVRLCPQSIHLADPAINGGDCARQMFNNSCHRSMVADALSKRYGAEIEHLLIKKRHLAGLFPDEIEPSIF
ncbi:MAG: DUF488 domain-containing protein [Betaproteobacteria bacterium]|nr:DUF488 domain-containing protein [Betaproteobacteria bacterium]